MITPDRFLRDCRKNAWIRLFEVTLEREVTLVGCERSVGIGRIVRSSWPT